MREKQRRGNTCDNMESLTPRMRMLLLMRPPAEFFERALRKEAETMRRLKIQAQRAILADPGQSPEAKAEAKRLLEAEGL